MTSTGPGLLLAVAAAGRFPGLLLARRLPGCCPRAARLPERFATGKRGGGQAG
jgi:hypothetical protein